MHCTLIASFALEKSYIHVFAAKWWLRSSHSILPRLLPSDKRNLLSDRSTTTAVPPQSSNPPSPFSCSRSCAPQICRTGNSLSRGGSDQIREFNARGIAISLVSCARTLVKKPSFKAMCLFLWWLQCNCWTIYTKKSSGSDRWMDASTRKKKDATPQSCFFKWRITINGLCHADWDGFCVSPECVALLGLGSYFEK